MSRRRGEEIVIRGSCLWGLRKEVVGLVCYWEREEMGVIVLGRVRVKVVLGWGWGVEVFCGGVEVLGRDRVGNIS